MNHGPDEKGPEGLGPDRDGLDSDREMSDSDRDVPRSDRGEPGSDRDGLPSDPGGLSFDLGAFGSDLGGLGSDEPDLRRLLHSAVGDIEPRNGTLDHLRRAVPARRARKRQALVGMAAAALFIGTAIPALIHVSNSGALDPNTAMAGQSSEAHNGTGKGKSHGGDSDTVTGSHGRTPSHGKGGHKGDEPGRTGGGGTGSASTADPSATASVNAPLCTSAQLSVTGGTGPSAGNQFYGSFRVSNISGTACTVGGTVTVTPTAQGAADPGKLVAVRHVAGDAATALPDPSLDAATLVLQPGGAYQEQVAFVPSETCPTTSGGSTGGSDTGVPSPDPSTSQDASATGTTDTSGAAGTTTQLVEADGVADGSVLLTFTGETGSPTASLTVPNACAGTVYYTGIAASGAGA
ncbi:hypothetical protein OIB37_20185 [Streptomyces sp. NBC_00820]|uniref:hypothetical protein n=1 Tax=Streptomyces sp. NBC_00820 TaxID=2975842 RepID=UPI002ED0B032|nr:hypothetical protein OIB37_20185 [Streptomyces sp. NBC_00820]